MKPIINSFCTLSLVVILSFSTKAQFIKTLRKQVENQVKNRASQRVGQGVDKGLDKVEDVATGKDDKNSSATRIEIRDKKIFVTKGEETFLKFMYAPTADITPEEARDEYELAGTNTGLTIQAKVKNTKPAKLLVTEGKRTHIFLISYSDKLTTNFYDYSTSQLLEQAATQNKAINGDISSNDADSQNDEVISNDAVFSIESKFDFIPGEKIIAFDDFSKVALGDFPANWNTNGKGEIVKINGRPEKWLFVNTKGDYMPDFNNLPDNYTFEFDLACSDEAVKTDGFTMALVKLTSKRFNNWFYNANGSISVGFKPGKSWYKIRIGGTSGGQNEMKTDEFFPRNNLNFVHVSMKIQNERLRVYMNQKKVWDLPKAFAETGKPNSIIFESYEPKSAKDGFFFTNLKLATGEPDTRNKLLTAGKFVTTGILFEVRSDEIKPESAGIIKEIANILKEDESVKIKITGYTDSEGDVATNLELSKRRAAAVKEVLLKNYEIDASRMVTDGLGSAKPVADNITAEGKAQNRRVEFIKL